MLSISFHFTKILADSCEARICLVPASKTKLEFFSIIISIDSLTSICHSLRSVQKDLKRQTAIRLATEQGQPNPTTNRDPPLLPLPEHQIQGSGYSQPEYVQGYTGNNVVSNHMPYQGYKAAKDIQQAPYQNKPYLQQQQPQYHPQYQPHPQSMNYHPETNYANYNRNYYNESQQTSRGGGPANQQMTQLAQSVSFRAFFFISFAKRCHVPNSQFPIFFSSQDRYARPGSAGPNNHPGPRHSKSRSREETSSNVLGSNLPSSKLPHGLTVNELKEMTKARLQAEALLDRHNEPEARRDPSMDNRRSSPLDFNSLPESRDRALSRDSASRNPPVGLLQGMASDSMQSIPSLVQVSQGGQEQNPVRQPQVSPIPGGFLNMSSVGQNLPSVGMVGQQRMPAVPSRDSLHHQYRPEAWETASSASQNTAVLSENLGSDSAHSSGLNFASDNLPNPRSRSYTCPAAPFPRSRDFGFNDEMKTSFTTSPGRGNTSFESAVGASRRRSCTNSPHPRPVSIHEDRPHLMGDDLALPSFSSSSIDQSPFLSPSRNNSYSPNLGTGGGYEDPIRPRALSATAIPQSSGQPDFDIGSSFQQTGLGNYNTPSFENNRARAKSEDVYRGRQNANIIAPPGFNAGDENNAGPGFGNIQGLSRFENEDDRNVVASASLGDTFPSLGLHPQEIQSFLNLSNSGDRPDRERSNTYPSASATNTEAFFTEQFLKGDPFRN